MTSFSEHILCDDEHDFQIHSPFLVFSFQGFSKSSLPLPPPSSHSVAVGFLLIFIYRADT
ncbi:hypothetical protein A2U01_0030625 [Trifolium medium]|uniref:Uncharacterized protein n=1 Tax=Trifolium medium TaxID=97028 RepID=A0A392PDJ0_9FABA|nr:hypothetical protein [Trifolium medium]